MYSKTDRMSHAYVVPVARHGITPPAPAVPGNSAPQPTVGTGFTPIASTNGFNESDDTGTQGNSTSKDSIADDADVNRNTVTTEGYMGGITGASVVAGNAANRPLFAPATSSDNTKKLVIVGIAVLGLYLIMK